MRGYDPTARPITTLDELRDAVRVGAHLEFTASGPGGIFDPDDDNPPDDYTAPPGDADLVSGWVEIDPANAERVISNPKPGYLLRAFYPITEAEPA